MSAAEPELHDELKQARRRLEVVQGEGASKYAQKVARRKVEQLEAELEQLELDAAEARLYSAPDAEEKQAAVARKAAEIAAAAAGFGPDLRALAAGQAEAARWRRDAAEQREVVQVMEDRYDGTEASAHALVEAIHDLRCLEVAAATAEASALADTDGTKGGFLG